MKWHIISLCLTVATWTMLASAQQSKQNTAPGSNTASSKTFHVEPPSGDPQVSVGSRASLGNFTSTCNEVTGQFQLDPNHLEAFAGRFSMPVAGIRTGIGLRDQHLRGPDWLDSARYPRIVMTFTAAQDVRRTSATSATMTLVGTCDMHGVTRDVRIPATLVYLEQSPAADAKPVQVSIRADFDIRLSDYNVKGKRMLGAKVEDIQRVRVSIHGTAESS